MSNNKARLFQLYRYRYENTDDRHYVSTQQILQDVRGDRETYSRNTVPSDIKELQDDQFNRQGDRTFYNGANNRSDNIYHAGGSAYGNHGPMYNGGSVSSFGGGQIFHSGNIYECDGQQYFKSGNTLFGPNGQRWYGDNMSDADIRDIISHNW